MGYCNAATNNRSVCARCMQARIEGRSNGFDCSPRRAHKRFGSLIPKLVYFTLLVWSLLFQLPLVRLAEGSRFQRSNTVEELVLQSLLRRVRSELLLSAGLESVLARVDRRLSLERAIQETERQDRGRQASSRSRGDPPPPGGWVNFGTVGRSDAVILDKQVGIWLPGVASPFKDSAEAASALSAPLIGSTPPAATAVPGLKGDVSSFYMRSLQNLCTQALAAYRLFSEEAEGLGQVPWVDPRRRPDAQQSGPVQGLQLASLRLVATIARAEQEYGHRSAIVAAATGCLAAQRAAQSDDALAVQGRRSPAPSVGRPGQQSARELLSIAASIAETIGADGAPTALAAAQHELLQSEGGGHTPPAIQQLRSAAELAGGMRLPHVVSWLGSALNSTKDWDGLSGLGIGRGLPLQLRCGSSADGSAAGLGQGGVCLQQAPGQRQGEALRLVTSAVRRGRQSDYVSNKVEAPAFADPLLGCVHLGIERQGEAGEPGVTVDVGQIASSRFAGASYKNGHGPRRKPLSAGTSTVGGGDDRDARQRPSVPPGVPTVLVHGHRYGAFIAPSLGSKQASVLPGVASHSVGSRRRPIARLNQTVARAEARRILSGEAGSIPPAVPLTFIDTIAGDGRLEKEDVERAGNAIRGLLSCPVSAGDKYKASLGAFLGISAAGRSSNSKLVEVLRMDKALDSLHHAGCDTQTTDSVTWLSLLLPGQDSGATGSKGAERCDVQQSWRDALGLAAQHVQLAIGSDQLASDRNNQTNLNANTTPQVFDQAAHFGDTAKAGGISSNTWPMDLSRVSQLLSFALQSLGFVSSDVSAASPSQGYAGNLRDSEGLSDLLSSPILRFAPLNAASAAGNSMARRRRPDVGAPVGTASQGPLESRDQDVSEQWPHGLPRPYEEMQDHGRQQLKRGGLLGPVLNPKRPMDHFLGIDWTWAGFRATQAIGLVVVAPARLVLDVSSLSINALLWTAEQVGQSVIGSMGIDSVSSGSECFDDPEATSIDWPDCLSPLVLQPILETAGGKGTYNKWTEGWEWAERQWTRLLRRAGVYRFVSQLWFVYDSVIELAFPPRDASHHRQEVLALVQTGVALTSMAAAARDRATRAAREAASIAAGLRLVDKDLAEAMLQQRGRMQLIAAESRTGIPCFATWSGEGAIDAVQACAGALLSAPIKSEGSRSGKASTPGVKQWRHAVWESEQLVAVLDAQLDRTMPDRAGQSVFGFTPTPWWHFLPPITVSRISFPVLAEKRLGQPAVADSGAVARALRRMIDPSSAGNTESALTCTRLAAKGCSMVVAADNSLLGLTSSHVGVMLEPRGNELLLRLVRSAGVNSGSVASLSTTLLTTISARKGGVSQCTGGALDSNACQMDANAVYELFASASTNMSRWLNPPAETSEAARLREEGQERLRRRKELLGDAGDWRPDASRQTSGSQNGLSVTVGEPNPDHRASSPPAWLRVLLSGATGVREDVPPDVAAAVVLSHWGHTYEKEDLRDSKFLGRWLQSTAAGQDHGIEVRVSYGELCSRHPSVLGAVSWRDSGTGQAGALENTRTVQILVVGQGPGACK